MRGPPEAPPAATPRTAGTLGGDVTLGGPTPAVDADIDSDNDNSTSLPDRLSGEDTLEADTDKPGKVLAVNDDDDDGDGVADYAEAEPVAGEDDFVRLLVEIVPDLGEIPLNTGTVAWELTYPDTAIRVWTKVAGVWSLVESGVAPPEHFVFILGDMNGDGAANNLDIDPYILALADPGDFESTYWDPGWPPFEEIGDINHDGLFNNFDTDAFVDLLVSEAQLFCPVRLWVEGLAPSAAMGDVVIEAEADTDDDSSLDESDTVRCTVQHRRPGAPRRWEAGLPVSPFSSANLANGNLITVIPLVGFDPVGPAVGFALYHNSAAVDDPPAPPIPGMDLGPGWSFSYSGRLYVWPNDNVRVVEDDGTAWDFAYDAGDYIAPVGHFDHLKHVGESPTDTWVLTRPNQAQRIFDTDGRLIEVKDSSGNTVTVVWEEGEDRIEKIVSAAEGRESVENHHLLFTYDEGTDDLELLTDPLAREWEFEFDAGELVEIHFPTTGTGLVSIDPSSIVIDYTNDRITSITSRDAKTWTYAYAESFVDVSPSVITDPELDADPDPIVYTHSFDWTTFDDTSGFRHTVYTDRREEDWTYAFQPAGLFRARIDPLTNERAYDYDADRNMDTFTDELEHTWMMTYGPVGNLETITSPLPGDPAQTWTLDWEQPDSEERPNFYRLIEVTDPLEHWVQYGYDDEGFDPTLVVSITEMSADGIGDPAVTTIEYYDDDGNNSFGQVRLVTDANDVKHEFEYDVYGYFSKLTEGLIVDSPGLGIDPCENGPTTNDANGNPTGADEDGGCASMGYDANQSMTTSSCCCWPCHVTASQGGGRLSDTVPAPNLNALKTTMLGSAQYSIIGQLLNSTADLEHDALAVANQRELTIAYDELRRVTSVIIASNEVAADGECPTLTRTFTYDAHDPDGRVLQRTGPDGDVTQYTYDERGFLGTVLRTGGTGVDTYTYDAAGRLESVEFLNGAKVLYRYDEANRIEHLIHKDSLNAVVFQFDYVWNLDNTLDARTETDATGGAPVVAIVQFSYDNRKRLIGEARTIDDEPDVSVYDLSYTYDQLGNRTARYDNLVAGRWTQYFYDADPGNRDINHQTNNNRLMWYDEYDPEYESGEKPVRTVKYTYYKNGRASNITIFDAGDLDGEDRQIARDLALYYAASANLWLAIRGTWSVDEEGDVVENSYATSAGREFRYDSLRGRYLSRAVNTGLSADPTEWSFGDALWTDYDGDEPYLDFTASIDGKSITTVPTMRYTGAGGTFAQQSLDALGDPVSTRYYHADLIGSTTALTDEAGEIPTGGGAGPVRFAYTAFGEAVVYDTGESEWRVATTQPAGAPRYQYAGAHGYENDLLVLEGKPGTRPIALKHVGARWYQPDIGRFVQRDPIGIAGGLNVYLYCSANPSDSTDAEGLWTDEQLANRGEFGTPRSGDAPEVIFLNWTGGVRTTYVDRVGNRIGRNTSTVADVAGLGGWRVGKGAPFPGKPSTTSVWTKVPGLSLKQGMILGRCFLPITLLCGAYDWVIIVEAAVSEW